MNSLDRISTLAIIGLCLVFFLWVAPNEIENVSYGRVVPKTFPYMAVGTILVAACVQFLLRPDFIPVEPVVLLRVALFVLFPILATIAMQQLGFEYAAPALALAIMLIIGERRWYWLVTGAFILPLGFLFLMEGVLDRVLP